MPGQISKDHLIRDFILGGCIVAGVSYLANHVQSSLAGLVAGMPIGLLLIYFVSDYNESLKYTVTHTLSILVLATVTSVFYYLYVILKKGKIVTLSYSIILWFVLILLIWYYN